jgi:hypothetical protein
MNFIELDRALRQLRLGGMAAVLETRLRQAHYVADMNTNTVRVLRRK